MAEKGFVTRIMFFWIVGGLCFIAATISTIAIPIYTRGQDARQDTLCERLTALQQKAALQYADKAEFNDLKSDVRVMGNNIEHIKQAVDKMADMIKQIAPQPRSRHPDIYQPLTQMDK